MKETNSDKSPDLIIFDNPMTAEIEAPFDRVSFDGHSLVWHGQNGDKFTAFSVQSDESTRESKPDAAPIP